MVVTVTTIKKVNVARVWGDFLASAPLVDFLEVLTFWDVLACFSVHAPAHHALRAWRDALRASRLVRPGRMAEGMRKVSCLFFQKGPLQAGKN